MCVNLSSKVNRQGHVIVFNIFDILDLENVRIDTKVNYVSCLTLIFKVMQYRYNFFIITVGFLDPENIPMRNIFKNSDGNANIQGVASTPLGVFDWRNTLGV